MGTTYPPLPPLGAIQRTLFTAPEVHIYAVPPLASNKGYAASQWTQNNPIFTASLHITETALPNQPATSTSQQPSRQPPANSTRSRPAPASTPPPAPKEHLTVDIVLEDPASRELFAAAPYNHPSVIQPCTDSSRFFAIRVVGDEGQKATLGLGFEERSDAFDFGIALQEARKVLGFESAVEKGRSVGKENPLGDEPAQKKDYSLKEGEMIKVDIAGRHGARRSRNENDTQEAGETASMAGDEWSLSGNGPLLPPPPSAADDKIQVHGDGGNQSLGFDDGDFGEFQ